MPTDADCSKLGQTSQVKGKVLHKTALTSDICHKLGGSRATHTSDQLAKIWKFPLPFQDQ